MSDLSLLYIIVVLLFAAAIMKIKLAEVKKEPLAMRWKLQRFIFPIMMLAVTVLFQAGVRDWVIQAVFIGIAEELLCWFIRKKAK